MKEKKDYESALILITGFDGADVIATSGLLHVDADEGSWV